ncbi:MAG: hypothetical protein ACI4R8_03635 [Candidatus Caccovivens sp.]
MADENLVLESLQAYFADEISNKQKHTKKSLCVSLADGSVARITTRIVN